MIPSWCPRILSQSLERQIVPCYDSLKSIVGVDEIVVSIFKHCPRGFLEDLKKNFVSNIAVLQEIVMPESAIVALVTNYPAMVLEKKVKFRETTVRHHRIRAGYESDGWNGESNLGKENGDLQEGSVLSS